ncbi:MAG: 30S ribosomal protein S18 [Candidatus Yanofskybacteria bacterium RIFOXYD1_FULL_44_17]|nr:MAG: 30S ribosomal protein S18 [Candidatus Yanofskybacteria bacterium RIFOXYA1_FULL_44_17]OGN36710.1 MAG: 30S ribosomal protein S18 [Candidatus Yanofskybacteria bacterium RIFOXYA2_FULL_45_28]OGN38226.1 MAG: 30S ribosomal protein S18 [Candidatus Yanofskybacteria bacterium RIFOXYB1_FULL_44_29]OGN39012.1 MAG: 30S ribosomal protein S18 [Candidatus Yanofskybacteria bacterium RIFOXYB2_FULL_44_18]OGN39205.1 MAG: 30S ribosomal protein S18 [Candidatus Yanofskybacteria bacterium RIFOXYC1_FULL_44_16]O
MNCDFCQKKTEFIDYKDTQFLRKFVTSQFKIGSSRRNRLCNKHQRLIANAVKLARYMAMMPYTRNQTVVK